MGTPDEFSEVINYRGSTGEWKRFLKKTIHDNGVSAMFGHGDCHFYHSVASEVAKEDGVDFIITEEGYIRPNFITIERGGVNANSDLMGNDFQKKTRANHSNDPNTYATLTQRALWCSCYYISNLLNFGFEGYKHRRNETISQELIGWIRTITRKFAHRKNTWEISTRKPFFLVPLQVYNDSQITKHSDYKSVEEFIGEVMYSFSKHDNDGTHLVFKHHPYSIGFSYYGDTIETLAKRYRMENRVQYIMEGHLPSLIKGSKGVVTINSTVGINTAVHNKPLMVMGKAFFNKKGISHQGSLDTFWGDNNRVCKKTTKNMIHEIKADKMLCASLYSHFDLSAKRISVRISDLINTSAL
ncbi:hypothetical protein [Vibrio crassostreae]|uniref:capsular polysaccharide export protein, LipB/KpsS family n=1 Tax=Vibrio crassostreae TaxID=246167 RepID=UPI001B305958|nr:hypothetical protein [Vibrio crassostreae]